MIAIHPVSLMLAVFPDYPDFSESIAYQISGLLVVFLALGGIWVLLEISGALFRRADARKTTVPVVDAASSLRLEKNAVEPSDPPADEAIDPLTSALIVATVHAASEGRARILSVEPLEPTVIHAIIAAAVHCTFEGRARIVSVSPIYIDPSWAREGRRDIFASRRVR